MSTDIILIYSFLLTSIFLNPPATDLSADNHAHIPKKAVIKTAGASGLHLYHKIDWGGRGVDYKIFQKALHGYNLLQQIRQSPKKKLLTIVDFNLPSNKKRLWVIDLENGTVPYHTLVAHGKNTGGLWAKEFSNEVDSHKSSLGFYLTGKTYYGKHGLSLRLQGLEKGFNDHAGPRAIVMHGADYVSQGFIRKYGRLGRSHGCPAIPTQLAPGLIKLIAGGSYLFVYRSDKAYIDHSKLINT